MINPEDLDFVVESEGPTLAPHTVRAIQKRARAPDVDASKRGRNNRKRGQRSELELARLFMAAGFTVIDQGGPGRRDMVVQRGDREWSVEHKSKAKTLRQDGWLQPKEIADAWTQAVRQADNRTPLVVAARRQQGVKTVWYIPDVTGEHRDFASWLMEVINGSDEAG